MSPTSYQTALSRDIEKLFNNGGERGIRTPAPFTACRFSRPIPSAGLGYFSLPIIDEIVFETGLVDPVGLEPTTNRL